MKSPALFGFPAFFRFSSVKQCFSPCWRTSDEETDCSAHLFFVAYHVIGSMSSSRCVHEKRCSPVDFSAISSGTEISPPLTDDSSKVLIDKEKRFYVFMVLSSLGQAGQQVLTEQVGGC